MSSQDKKFDSFILWINKCIIKILMIILTLCLILALGSLVQIVYHRIISPPFLLIDITLLFEIFNLVLIIAVGYELVKSLSIIISSDVIPTRLIIQIAIIAIANKIITLDMKNVKTEMLYGMASILIGLGAAFYFLHNPKQKNEE